MWHLKTKQGTFWIMPSSDVKTKYFFGVDNTALGIYKDVAGAINDVRDQVTGHIKWDCLLRVTAPSRVDDWATGVPDDWN